MYSQPEESRAAVLLAFVNQAAPDIRRKLQKIEGLREQTIQDLLKAAEKVFNNRNTPEEREERFRWEERELAEKIRKEDRAYCKEQGHWKNECPNRDPKRRTTQRENFPWNSSSICGARQ